MIFSIHLARFLRIIGFWLKLDVSIFVSQPSAEFMLNLLLIIM